MRLKGVGIAVALALAALAGWRALDHRADRAEMDRLLALQPRAPQTFERALIADLPEPAQRYFTFTIENGTDLLPVAEIAMTGLFGLGDQDDPEYLQMHAHQVLAAPHGFVWKMQARSGHLWLSGSDSAQWTRFWMGGILPVARIGPDPDHARAAFGRYVAEAVFWTPAALLPGPNIKWEEAGPDIARVTIRHAGMEQTVDISVAADGRPTSVQFARWSDANPQGVYRLQPFGGHLSEFREVYGYHLPTHIEAGNFFGTDAYFPFYIIDVTKISYPLPPD